MTAALDAAHLQSSRPRPAPPLVLVAELTHRCPLQCVYCSNPLQLLGAAQELGPGDWRRVLAEAEGLGILQVLYTGGEPLLRADLGELLRAGRTLDLYQVLITSGVGLSARRLRDLLDAGLDAVQLSLQSLDDLNARTICGGDFLKRKHEAAALIRESGTPLILNAVLHRLNLHEVPALLQFAADSGAERIELANSQYYGWALENRAHLLPDLASLQAAEAEVLAFRGRCPEVAVQWVVPDYHDASPKPCMGGWASTHLIVGPDGRALPCPAAYVLPELAFPNVRTSSLEAVWYDSAAFQAYRGTAWMREPCQTCPQREVDFGGCRCQAFLLTGDARAADPVCSLSPHRGVIDAALEDIGERPAVPLRHRPRTA
ncbi:pyrroloquinoline quinone biosynthesis protein PqqE [Deinococcus koreensis]|uniref:PqqA peptide cyclase n=1 Tax=Deinococcus koreensis TaxID=2054903 RepID=A0A2K3UW97_9DEIO|nr:pyrroloquinoline quinone biosynthesis protein PqqE [Deinococcus koreensis]PNY80791.1 pyrroloquinoline quinone biosynthesis protein PqqE [Deinococcus koreensis]